MHRAACGRESSNPTKVAEMSARCRSRSCAAHPFVSFYAAMAGAALVVELIFGTLGLVPAQRNARVVEASVTWNYTTWLNIAFLVLAAVLIWRFLRTDGPEMLRMMNRSALGHTHRHSD